MPRNRMVETLKEIYEGAIYTMYQTNWHGVQVTCAIKETKYEKMLLSSDTLIPREDHYEFVSSITTDPVDISYTRNDAIDKMNMYGKNHNQFIFVYF